MDKYEALEYYFGYKKYRNKQDEIIDSLLENKDTLAILSTGGGKSICFQIPALLKEGLTIVISPLISLMTDQVRELKEKRIKAEYINSEQEWYESKRILNEVKNQKIKLLYLSPERLENEKFIRLLIQIDISQIIVDEAHCISIWGKDFRPSYGRIKDLILRLPKRPCICAFTATANKRVINDITQKLTLLEPNIFKGSFDRSNLFYEVAYPKDKRDYIFRFILKHSDEAGIVYCLTRKKTEEVYSFLNQNGFYVGKYHGGMEAKEKDNSLMDFMNGKVLVMVATNAFGMGINKTNIRYVINYEIPQSLEDLSQQSGRCSRDGKPGKCVLLFDPKDIKGVEFFIKNTKAESKEMEESLKKEKYKSLKSVIDYATTKKCLHQYMVNYFGELGHVLCNNCSNCKKKK